MSGFTLDAGALIAFERNERAIVSLIARAYERGDRVAVPAGVVAQTWRDGRRQVRLVRLLAAGTTEIVPLDDRAARSVGQLCGVAGVAGVADVIDAAVVWCARERGHAVLTSDPDDLLRLDPTLGIKIV
ncbi:MAG: PIN domain-containing protein [Egibacteraceae bacterium]